MIVYKIQPNPCFNWCSEIDLDIIIEDYLKKAQPGDIITIEVLEMTEGEYLNLPEFYGF